jgi:hypothetical protein
MPNWEKVGKKIDSTDIFSSNHVLNTAHRSTKHKLEAANLHLSILNQAYGLSPSHAMLFLNRTMTESILFNLASGLDSLAHVINQIYRFDIEFRKVQIDHHFNEKECLRCKLDKANNDYLSQYLNTQIPRSRQDQDHWYKIFTDYWNRVKHRTLYIINISTEGLFLPDDPTNLNPLVKPYHDANTHEIVYPNYT